MMSEIGGIQCQKGYYNMFDVFVDTVHHCAGIDHEPKSPKKFSDQKVQWDGATPMHCLKTCIARESGAVNDESTGLHENRTRTLLFSGFQGPGGNATTRNILVELLECDRKHPTNFPKKYRNCTGTEIVFKCDAKAFRGRSTREQGHRS